MNIPAAAWAAGGVIETFNALPLFLKIVIYVIVGAFLLAFLAGFLKELLIGTVVGTASSVIRGLITEGLRAGDRGGSTRPEVIFIKQTPRAPTPSDLRKKAMDDLRDLIRRDPNFSLPEFEQIAATVFTRWHEALAKKDPAPVKNHLMPGLRGKLEEEIDKLKREERNYVRGQINVTGIEIAGAGSDSAFDSITTVIRARAVGEAGQKRGLKGRLTFLRSGEVKTKKGESGPSINKCPSCGAPLSISAAGKCDYCGTEVNLPAFAWTLSAFDNLEDQAIAEDASGLKVIGQIKCPRCGKMVNDLEGVTTERCPRCGAMINTES